MEVLYRVSPRIVTHTQRTNNTFPRVFIFLEAFKSLWVHSLSSLQREVGGILVGDLYKDDIGGYLDITAALEATHALEKKSSITFTHQSWIEMSERVEKQYPDKRILGWYHTHPGFGTFLSDDDKFVHKNFFNRLFQVALVIDPVYKRQKLFRFNKNNLLDETDQIYVYGNSENDDHILLLARCYVSGKSGEVAENAIVKFFKSKYEEHGAARQAISVNNEDCSEYNEKLFGI